MHRLVLHGESHTEDKTKKDLDGIFYNFISPEEIQMTARSILTFIYHLDPFHIEKHLGNKDKCEKIKKWCEDIEKENI
jgi:hypothetical protein